MKRSSKGEYRVVPVLFAVFLLMPMAAVAQESNAQLVEDPDILHDVALSLSRQLRPFLSVDLDGAWRLVTSFEYAALAAMSRRRYPEASMRLEL